MVISDIEVQKDDREKIASANRLKKFCSVGFFIFGFNFLTTAEYVFFHQIFEFAGLTKSIQRSILLGSALIALCLGAIIGGILNDSLRTRFGQRAPSIFLGTIVASVLILGIPLITQTLANHTTVMFYLLLVIFIASHLCLGFALSPWLALVPDLFKKKERISAAIAISVFSAVGAAIAVMVFSRLADNELFWVIWIITGVILAVSGIITSLMIPRKNPEFEPKVKINDIWKIPRTIVKFGGKNWCLLLVISSLWAFSTHLVETGIVKSLVDRLDISNTEASFASNILMGCYIAVMIIPIIWFGNKLGKIKSSIIASAFYGLFCILLAVIQDFSWIYYIMIIGGIANILISTLLIALPADIVPKGREASFLGTFFVFGTAVKPLATFIQGIIVDNGNVDSTSLAIFGGHTWVFMIAAIVAFSSIILLIFVKEDKIASPAHKTLEVKQKIKRKKRDVGV